ncbi:PAP2 superfamily protein [Rosistilla oblonga]|uniref:PAP2 superfamily protein n=1 Tax=Rosistilla oblonga TaxID=2527990 RepID=A0A518IZA4_9BACT|nr:PAP2 superfamily protein [Rosistilla oblonga]
MPAAISTAVDVSVKPRRRLSPDAVHRDQKRIIVNPEPQEPSLKLYPGPAWSARSSKPLQPLLWFGVAVTLLSPLALFCDYDIAVWFWEDRLPGDFRKAIYISEFFSHGLGVAMIITGIAILVPEKRWCLPRLAALSFGSGAIVTILKMFILRRRPNDFDFSTAREDSIYQWSLDAYLQHVAIFDDSTLRSFPSGHAATAVGLCIGMMLLFPRGRIYFVCMATLACTERLLCQAHFLSDVLGGVAVATLWSYICLHPRMLGVLFGHMEPEGRGFKVPNVDDLRGKPYKRAA